MSDQTGFEISMTSVMKGDLIAWSDKSKCENVADGMVVRKGYGLVPSAAWISVITIDGEKINMHVYDWERCNLISRASKS